jgi:uncharacterized protein (DUF1800 family)
MTAILAANRFGLGARPGELAAIGGDPRGWLKAQLDPRHAMPTSIAALPGTEQRLATLPAVMGDPAEAQKKLAQAVLKAARDQVPQDSAARLQAAITSKAPLVERLVAFWSNHFTVSGARPIAAGLIGPYEAEAIRPNLFGRFVDLLKAATLHPAMLLYLDNATSIGPNSRAGTRRGKGLNENLARELMELHTLGVDGGYTQTDVTELAKILTGWTIRSAPLPRNAAAPCSSPRSTSPATRSCSARPIATRARTKPMRRWKIFRAARRPRASSPPSWRDISSPTIRRKPR